MMVAVPALTPVMIPEPGSTVATEGTPLLQVPPNVTSANTVLDPAHALSTPTIVAGIAIEVSVAVTKPQPVV